MHNEIISYDDFKKLNEKKKDQQYSSGCLMGYFNSDLKKIKIDEEDLYNNEENEYGLEIEPHVTILYGLDDKIKDEDIINLFTLINGPVVKTNKISLFENEKYDVVKWEIESKELILLNKMVTSMFPYKSDFDYNAHSTIAYCLPGKGKKYKEKFKTSIEKKIDYWVYSKANGEKIKITPGKESKIINENILTEPTICLMNSIEDKSFEYRGYTVNLKPNEKFFNSYMCSVYLDGLYKMGIKGPCNFIDGKEAAINFINLQIDGNR